jgi:predicted acylesterase/phospholipase RssA
MNKILVIGGGGSKGSYALGLIHNKWKEYNKFVGTSTGALIASLLSIDKYDELVKLYMNLKPEDIYTSNPFNRKGHLNISKLIYRLITKKKSIADTKPLLDLIRKHYTPIAHQNAKECIVVITDVLTNKPKYISNKKTTWNEFSHYIYKSTLAYPFTDILDNEMDGGFSVPVPIINTIVKNPKSDIDVIILDVENEIDEFKTESIPQGISSVIELLLKSLRYNELEQAKHLADHYNCNVHYYYTPYVLTYQSMNFNKALMQEWYKLGKLNRIK